jgi:hypothetical protein
LALIAASGAKAGVVESFNLSGSLNSFLGAPSAFNGTIVLDFAKDFSSETLASLSITVQGRPVFNQSTYLDVSPWANEAVIDASNSSGDTLYLLFATPNPGAWTAFDTGAISGGEVIFGGLTGMLLGATGVVTRDPSDLAILAPPTIDPPDPISVAPVPEASTWAMLLLGFVGLGLAAKGRRAIGFLAGRA